MRELTMVDLSVYTNHRMGDMYYNTPFTLSSQCFIHCYSFHSLGRFFFREVSVNDDIVVKLIVFCSPKCLREEIDSRDMFNIFVGPVLKPKETHSLYTHLLAFYWLGGNFFIFIWEVRIRYWSRNLSQEFHRDVLMKRNPNWCIVAFWWSEIQIDVSSHFDEAKSKSMYRRILMKRNPNRCIVAFWWSEI